MNTLLITTPRKYKLFKWLFGAERTIFNKTAPSGWGEINLKQFRKLVELFFFTQVKENEKLAIATLILYNLPRRAVFLFEPDQLYKLTKKCDWVFSEPLTIQLLPSIKIGRTKLHGPGNDLRGYTGDEFQYADTYFMRYIETGEEQFLNKMIAVLYRPMESINELGDIREKFASYKMEERTKKIAKLNPWKKMAIFLFYKGCRQKWEEYHPELFNADTEPEGESSMWHTILLRISGKEFGDYNKTTSQPVHNLFALMNQDIIDFNKQKAKNKQN